MAKHAAIESGFFEFEVRSAWRPASEGGPYNCKRNPRLASGRASVAGWGRGRGESGRVDGDVLFDAVELDGELVAGAGERPAKRDLDAAGGAVVRVVDLRGVAAEGSL